MNFSLKTFMATTGTSPQKENAFMRLPLFSIVATAGSHSLTILTEKLGRNIKIFSHLFAQEECFISAATRIPNMPPETINDILNYNWLTNGLCVIMNKLN